MPISVGDPLPPEDWVGYSTPVVTKPVDVDQLYRSQRRRLLGLFSRSGFGEDGPDLLQEAFRRLIMAVRRLGGTMESPEAYLHRIAQNLAHEAGRFRPEHGHLDIHDMEFAGLDLMDQIEARDSLDRVEALLGTLKPRTREIFLMHRLDGLSYGEIAQATGISVKGVEKQMSKALFALRRRSCGI